MLCSFLKDVQHYDLENFMQLLKLHIQPMTVILMIIWLKIMKLMMTLTVMVTMTMVVVMNLMMLVVIFMLIWVSTSTLVHPLCGQAMVLLTSSCRSFFGFILSDSNHIHISFFLKSASIRIDYQMQENGVSLTEQSLQQQ